MALILHIDTALALGSVGISEDGNIVLSLQNEVANNHAAFVQPAIEKLLSETAISSTKLDAIAVVAGPGSYTGLRVGMASAKGLCYALDKPLLAINTLALIAASARTQLTGYELICPMIDARRNEVFTAVYKNDGETLLQPCPMVLNEESFLEFGAFRPILFVGDGAEKAKIILNNNSYWKFMGYQYPVADIGSAVFKSFINRQFQDLAYAEPFYLKDFYMAPPKN